MFLTLLNGFAWLGVLAIGVLVVGAALFGAGLLIEKVGDSLRGTWRTFTGQSRREAAAHERTVALEWQAEAERLAQLGQRP